MDGGGPPGLPMLPDGSAGTWSWDAEGNLTRHVSPAGAITAYEHGPFGKPVTARRPDGTSASFAYDPDLRASAVTYGGLTWRYSYDRAGHLVSETDYNGAITRYSHDAAGQLTRRVNAAGQAVTYAYDRLGNLISQVSGDAGGQDAVTDFGYDQAGRLILARNADAEVTFTRDNLGRITAETCDGQTISTTYDPAGRITSRTTPSGTATTWTYGAAGLPAAMHTGGQELRFSFDTGGQERLRELPGGLALTQDWDQLGRLSGQVLEGPMAGGSLEGPSAEGSLRGAATSVLQRRSYAYNPDGFVTGITDLLTGDRTFGLDPSGRVTTVTGAEWTERYTYDPAGNLASANWPGLPPETSASLSGSLTAPLSASWLENGPQGTREVAWTLITHAGSSATATTPRAASFPGP